MFKAGIDQASKMHNSVVILTSGGVALAPSILFYSSHFGDVDKWAFGAGVFILILATGMLLYEFSLLIEAYLIDDKISESTDLEEMFQNIKNDKFLLNWYRFLQVGKRDQESLHLVIDQLAFRLLFWLTLLQGTIIGISTFAFNQWNEYSNIIIWEIVLFLLIAPFLIFRILQIGKYLYLLRELSLPENLNILIMKPENKMYPCCCFCCCCENKNQNTSQDAEPTNDGCSCKMNQCKRAGQFGHCHEDLPKEGELIAVRKEWHPLYMLSIALGYSLLCYIFIILIITVFRDDNLYIMDDSSIMDDVMLVHMDYGIPVFFVLFSIFFFTVLKYYNGTDSIHFTNKHLYFNNKPIDFDFVFFLDENTIPIEKKDLIITKRFSKHPEKLVAFLNAKQKAWKNDRQNNQGN